MPNTNKDKKPQYHFLRESVNELRNKPVQELYDHLEERLDGSIQDKTLKAKILHNVDKVYAAAYKHQLLMEKSARGETLTKKENLELRELAYARESLINANILMSLTTLLADQEPSSGNKHIGDEAIKGAHFVIDDDGELFKAFHQLGLFRKNARYSSHYKERQSDTEQNFDWLLQSERRYIVPHPRGVQTYTDPTRDLPISYDTKSQKKELDRSVTAEGIFEEGLFMFAEVNGKMCTCFQFEGHSHHESRAPLKGIWAIVQKLLKCVGYSLELAGHHCDYVQYRLTGKNVSQYGLSEHTDQKPITVSFNKPAATAALDKAFDYSELLHDVSDTASVRVASQEESDTLRAEGSEKNRDDIPSVKLFREKIKGNGAGPTRG